MSGRAPSRDVVIRHADRPEDLDAVRTLLREYQASLGIDLSFQGFERELEVLPGDYGPPDGALFLAVVDGVPAGCVGVRRWDSASAEMKRLYLRPAARGLGLGRRLAEHAVALASSHGYRAVLLDTLPTMVAAHALYRAMGFVEALPYRDNPVTGTTYFRLDLDAPR